MTDLNKLQTTLTEKFQERICNFHILRGNELHFQISRGCALELEQILHADFNAELQLMIAIYRRADKSGF